MTDDAFFLPLDETGLFQATSHARGPWDPGAQHGGPPAALIGHVLQTSHPRDSMQFVRLTFEILRPVPLARLRVSTQIARGGRSVELLRAELTTEDHTPLVNATAWRIRTAELPLTGEDTGIEGEALTGPEQAQPGTTFFREVAHPGYVHAMETRFVRGGWADPGPSVAWLRMRHPLVAGVEPTPLVRTLIAADSGNGLSARFEGLFINPELTVHLTRLPQGEWVGMDASTTLTDHGIGLATSVLHDRSGPFGRGSQSLLLDLA